MGSKEENTDPGTENVSCNWPRMHIAGPTNTSHKSVTRKYVYTD